MRVRKSTAVFLMLAPIAFALSLLSANAILTCAVLVTAVVLAVILYRPGEPPVLLFAAGMQWLQVSAKVLQADIKGVPVADLQFYFGDLSGTIIVALIGVVCLALGMRFGIGKLRVPPNQAYAEAEMIPISRVWRLYLLSVALSLLLTGIVPRGSGLFQIAMAILSVKWAFLFLLVFTVMARSKGYAYLTLAVLLELGIGFGGFFSDFKTVFYIVLIAAMTTRLRISVALGIALGAFAGLLLVMSIIWSAIKVDYRDYVNEGSGQQVVSVPYSERMTYLFDKVVSIDSAQMDEGTDALFERVAYVDFLTAVRDYVPASEPHTNGVRVGAALMHVFTPRLFFPSKPPTESDSDVTHQFTGLFVMGQSQGTSISIGYFAECYVDFGPYLMYLPIFGLGFLAGRMYRFVLTRERNLLLTRFGLAVMVLFGLGSFETALIKLFGSLVTTFLAAWVISHFFARRLEQGYLMAGGSVSPSPPGHGGRA